ncbi:MAG: aromatic ring-hydroxylating dioxygenase subunit alpha [Sneathiellaceae bacterium]
MQKAEQLALIERARHHIAARSTEREAGCFRTPAGLYTDPQVLAAERASLFRRYPLAIATGDRIAAPGDWMTHDRAGVPILLVRGADGRAQAFLNVCRHRGVRLAGDADGSPAEGKGAKAFVCPYHAWTYGLDGQLAGMPHGHGFPDLEAERCGLVRLPVTERAGILFVTPSTEPAVAADAWLDPILGDLENWVLAGHVRFAPRTPRLAANWKFQMEGSMETYHFRYAHRNTIAQMFFDALSVFDRFGPHMRLFLPKREIRQIDAASLDDPIRTAGNLLYIIHPNTILLVQPDHVQLNTVWPVDPGQSVVDACMMIPAAPSGEKARRHWERNSEIFWGAIAEDYAMMESMQSTLASGANPDLVFAEFEHSVRWFHQAMAGAMGTTPAYLSPQERAGAA